MHKITSTGSRRSMRSVATLALLLLVLANCAGGMDNVLVTQPSYQAHVTESRLSTSSPVRVRIGPVKDVRTEFGPGGLIGKRTTIGDTRMGHIEMSPLPTELIAQMLRSELSAAGHMIVTAGEDLSLDTKLHKFRVTTPATLFYWDVNGAVEVTIGMVGSGGKMHAANYATTCTKRTFVWPSQEIITTVVTACIDKIAAQLRDDAALAKFLGSG